MKDIKNLLAVKKIIHKDMNHMYAVLKTFRVKPKAPSTM